MQLTPKRLDHVAYRCRDAQETTDFYTRFLDMDLVAAITAAQVQSTKEMCPHIHIFFAMKDGSCVAFFETPEEKPMGKDPNTPDWVQHLALQVDDMDTLLAAKARLEEGGIKVIGPKVGHLCTSIYFFDPNGHRLELSIVKTEPNEMTSRDARRILDRWNETKKPVTDIQLECPI